MVVTLHTAVLIADIEQPLQTVTSTLLQEWDLNDDTIMRQALNETVFPCYHVVLIIQITATDINDRFLQLAQRMPLDIEIGNLYCESTPLRIFSLLR